MNDAHRVGRLDRIGHLQRDVEGALDREATGLFDQTFDIPAREQLQ